MKNLTAKSKKILYIGDVGSSGTAMFVHAQNMAKLLNSIVYEVLFICNAEKGNREASRTYNGFKYLYSKKYINIPKLSAAEWLLDSLFGWKYIKQLKKQIKTNKPEAVMFYGYSGEKRLIKLCHKNGIKLFIERVDWFEKTDRSGFVARNILQRLIDNSINKTDMQADGIIAISPFLYNHYKQKKQNVIFIPPVFNVEKDKKIKRNNEAVLKLVYAGSFGGNKDNILPILFALREINKNGIKISFDFVGDTMQTLEVKTDKNDWVKYGVTAHGRVSNDIAKEIISNADFSILLRQNKRYAKAGFSTKFAESMCLGVPVICTAVGGADTVVTDMVDGVLLHDNEVSTVRSKLSELLSKSNDEILLMKQNAYYKALEMFSLENYTELLKRFLNNAGEVK